ncbi:helix-turn-helix transcriptional regulator [Micromonospora sp. RP3T]|uniref:helix-turn-helix transcriptional regulator n=1 Tax=Micromonospora sp. RP3T TaxID=2135446 RepID=UPI003D750E13
MTHPQNLVGRTDEFRRLCACLPHAPRPAERGAFLIGDPGTGKTRLVTELLRKARADGLTALPGRCSSAAGPVPYRPYAEAVSALSRTNGVPADPELEPLRPVLGRLVPEWACYADDSVGAPLVLAEALLRLLGAVGRRHGCLLVLEDLHHADPQTLAVTEYLVDNLAGQPAALVATTRAEAGPAYDLAENAALRRVARSVRLDPLERPEVAQLAAQRLRVAPDQVPRPVLDRLDADGDGNPFVVEELLAIMVTEGQVRPGADAPATRTPAGPVLPPAVVCSITQQVRRLPSETQDALRAAALLGTRFPVDLLAAALRQDEPAVRGSLRPAVDRRLIRPDDAAPGWYRFRAALAPRSLVAPWTAAERRETAEVLADAAQRAHPAPPGHWLPLLAVLRGAAGQRSAAATLHSRAGRDALGRGAARLAVDQLTRAWDLSGDAAPDVRAELLDHLLAALVDGGEPARALDFGPTLDTLAETLPPARTAGLRARLAAAAGLAGRCREGLGQVRTARRDGDGLPPQDLVELDLAEARLLRQLPERTPGDRLAQLAARAHRTAGSGHRPDQVCAALEVQALAAGRADPRRARSGFEAMLRHAESHELPGRRIRALAYLGVEDAWRRGCAERLHTARAEAARLGHLAVTTELDATAAVLAALRGDHGRAQALAARCRRDADRLGHTTTARYAALAVAVSAAHQGHRREMEEHLSGFRDGTAGPHLPTAVGLAEACCALVEEDRERAGCLLAEAGAAEAAQPFAYPDSGAGSLGLLLAVVDGRAGAEQYRAAAALPQAELRWTGQFLAAAEAVLLGRAGQATSAEEALRRARAAAAPFPLAEHLLMRLVSEAAFADGWGNPASWTRSAEEWFRAAGLPAPAAACRALLRRAGLRVTQHRRGCERIPSTLREAGVTAREFEVLVLLARRLRNAEIGRRLFISARTVEKHVTHLLVKVGKSTRTELVDFARTAGLVPQPE